MKIYAINFNSETLKIEVDILEIEYDDLDEQYIQLVQLLDGDCLEVIDYNKNIAILVDDRGFEKQYNPVFEIITEDNLTFQLAGRLLFVRNIYNKESTDFGSITTEDVQHLRNHLQISIKGLLRNPL